MQKAMGFNNIAIAYVKGVAFRTHFWYMSKDDAINIMNGSNMVDKKSVLSIFFIIYKIFLLHIKMGESTDLTYYQKTLDVILSRAKDLYENDKERLRRQARDKYRNLSEEEKNKKREYGKNRCRNMSEDKKQRLKKHQKNYRETKMSQYNNE